MTIVKRDQKEKISLILTQFQEQSPKLVEFILSFLKECNELEDIYQELLDQKDLDLAEGVFLDIIGAYVGESRNNRDDESYRQGIKVRIAVNTSSGTVEDLIGVLNLLFGEDVDVIITRSAPASIQLYLGIPQPSEDLIALLQQTIAAGVEISSILYSDNRLPWIPTERDGVDGTTGILPERGDNSGTVRIPPERV